MFANKKGRNYNSEKIVEKGISMIVIGVLHLCDMFTYIDNILWHFFVLKAGILTLGME